MVVNVEIDAVEYTLPVELHDEILEPNEFLGHYPPPFLYKVSQYRYILKSPLCQRKIPENYWLFFAGEGKEKALPKKMKKFPKEGLISGTVAILAFGGAYK